MVHHPSEGDEEPGEPLLSPDAVDNADSRPDATPGTADPARADDRTAEHRRRDGWFPV
ncbi:hypothetical protein [Actinophytocola xinjiangensis]|uniref:hypothetical protein n=1 Tax=Actinophytocola xinjiangensis TaxID=485602 RepID=UPI0012B94669|nr:hypothetical protein [Actinophytocola xinjiangensis]